MKTITRRTFASGIALLPSLRLKAAQAQAAITPADARAIAQEAYIYGYPMVDSYRIEHAYFVNPKDPEYKAPWNQIRNIHASTRRQIRRSRPPTRTRPTPGSAWICAPNRSCSQCR